MGKTDAVQKSKQMDRSSRLGTPTDNFRVYVGLFRQLTLHMLPFPAQRVITLHALRSLSAQSLIQLTQLRCEYHTNPIGIDVVHPRLN